MSAEKSNVFAIKVIPFSVNYRRNALSVTNITQRETACSILSKVYMVINEKFMISKNMPLFADKLNASYFCCCFDDGFAAFSFLADSQAEKLELRGIFISDEYMRTAWKLYRGMLFYFLYFDCTSEKLFEPEDIMNEVHSIQKRLSDSTNERLKELGKQLMSKEIPCNCAFAKFQLSYLPISFNNYQASEVSAEPAEKDAGIMIDKNQKSAYKHRLDSIYPKLSNIRLCCSSAKTYLSLKKDELKQLADKEDHKAKFKEEKEKVSEYEHIWYFSYKLGRVDRYDMLRQNNCLDFPIHYADVLDYFVSEYKNLSSDPQKEKVQMEEIGLIEKEAEPPKKRFGFFKR